MNDEIDRDVDIDRDVELWTMSAEQLNIIVSIIVTLSIARLVGVYGYKYITLKVIWARLVCKRIWNQIWIRFRIKENEVREKNNILLKNLF